MSSPSLPIAASRPPLVRPPALDLTRMGGRSLLVLADGTFRWGTAFTSRG